MLATRLTALIFAVSFALASLTLGAAIHKSLNTNVGLEYKNGEINTERQTQASSVQDKLTNSSSPVNIVAKATCSANRIPSIINIGDDVNSVYKDNVHRSQTEAMTGITSLNHEQHENLYSPSFSKNRCSQRDVPLKVDLADALDTYMASRRGTSTLNTNPEWASVKNIFQLPDGCHYTEKEKPHQCHVVCMGNMTAIPAFSHIIQLDSLYFVGTHIHTVTDLSHLPYTLHALHFSNSRLKSFFGQDLHRIHDLQCLALDKNVISEWSFSTVFDASDGNTQMLKITHLDVQSNYITYPPMPVDSGAHVLPNLEVLVMSHNPLCNLYHSLFHPLRQSPVQRLYLKNCSIRFIEMDGADSPLKYLPQLSVLDLSSNPSLNADILESLLAPLSRRNLTELYLANNNYNEVPTKALEKVNGTLTLLDLHYSWFPCIDNATFPPMPNLQELNLMYCRINTITEGTFDNFPSLQRLHLDGNLFKELPTAAFLPSLSVFTFSDNPRVQDTSGSVSFEMDKVNFTNNLNLKDLNFNKVVLGTVKVYYFNPLRGLQSLYLRDCNIQTIEPESFMELSKLEKLDLSQNMLTVLNPDTFVGLTGLRILDLSYSHLKLPVPLMRVSTQPASIEGAHGDATPTKLLPAWLWTKKIEVPQDSPAGVNPGAKNLRTSPVNHEGTYNVFSNLSSLQALNISGNKIIELTPYHFRNNPELTTIDFDDNLIQSWSEPIFNNLNNLTIVYMRNNNINNITQAMAKDFTKTTLTKVNLTGNNIDCSNCITSTIIATMDMTNIFGIPDCSRSNDTTKDTPTTCPYQDDTDSVSGYTSFILTFCICLATIIITTVALYRRRWYVRYLIYTLKMRKDEHRVDTDKYHYDTFVCYSETDRQWVFEHLVAKLEDGGRYRVCVHERDFTVGQEITDNIVTSVEHSRKVVVVLSPAFIQSSWCMFELQMASNKILDERKSKLILLLLQHIPEDEQPKKLRFLMKTRTYIEWLPDMESQKLFWARLLRAIAKPSDSEARSENTRL